MERFETGLFATSETPLRGLIRSGASDEDLISAIQGCLMGKAKAHGIDQDGFPTGPIDRCMQLAVEALSGPVQSSLETP